ncbi:MAG: response regulator [Rhodospirillales bacterium]|nr:response regulator [Rhodospirillales bacterium]
MSVALQNMRFLIAEDNKQSAKLIEMLLRDLGSKDVVMAHNGTEAWDYINGESDMISENSPRKRPFDLIICDWNMPELTGFDLLKKIRREGFFMPFIMITGRGTVDSVINAMEAGVTEFLPKPFTPHQLTQKIFTILDSKETHG